MINVIRQVCSSRPAIVFALAWGMSIGPAHAFCIRNDTGAPIRVEAIDGTARFGLELPNNKRACCSPKDEACAIGEADVTLGIKALESDAYCEVSVTPKGNVNVTGRQDSLKCKANKAGSTMDWASG